LEEAGKGGALPASPQIQAGMAHSKIKEQMKTHYSIFVAVPKGEGDYGSERKCVFDDKNTETGAKQLAQSFANLFRSRVEVFKGKSIGRFQFAIEA